MKVAYVAMAYNYLRWTDKRDSQHDNVRQILLTERKNIKTEKKKKVTLIITIKGETISKSIKRVLSKENSNFEW